MIKPAKARMLKHDPRLGKRVLFLGETQKRGYEVIGTLVSIEQFNDGDELWTAFVDGWQCYASSHFFRIIE